MKYDIFQTCTINMLETCLAPAKGATNHDHPIMSQVPWHQMQKHGNSYIPWHGQNVKQCFIRKKTACFSSFCISLENLKKHMNKRCKNKNNQKRSKTSLLWICRSLPRPADRRSWVCCRKTAAFLPKRCVCRGSLANINWCILILISINNELGQPT